MNTKSEIAAPETQTKMVKWIIISKISDSVPSDNGILHRFSQTQGWLNISFLKIDLFIYFWLLWVFTVALSLVVASGVYSSLWCAGFSLQWLLLLRSMGSRHAGFSSCGSRALECRLSSCGTQASVAVACGFQSVGSVVGVHGLSCSVACGIFPDHGSNLCPLHWQADS